MGRLGAGSRSARRALKSRRVPSSAQRGRWRNSPRLQRSVAAAGYERSGRSIDPSVVRGLEYYTGPVFEAELTFEVKDEDGQPVRFGSVGGGGRYDGLVARFRAEPVPATGFSIGVSRLLAALQLIGRPIAQAPTPGPVVVLVMDKAEIAGYQRMVADAAQAPASAPNSISARRA